MCKAESVRVFLMKNEAGYTRECTWAFQKIARGQGRGRKGDGLREKKMWLASKTTLNML